ncbi:MAG TPA: TIGR03435 family protein [Acidobacteriaceae bacterium]|jgi:uncharacterized protein (TIGR03435 family)|nr:TIGR03435 family protein [Acidobacteriaceae bacterium]
MSERILTTLVLFLALTAAPSHAQTAPASPNPPLAFDVVTIKVANPERGLASSWSTTSDGFRAMTTIQNFVQNAFNFVLEDQILNLPGWATSDHFAIDAKMDPDTSAAFNKLPHNQQDRQWDRMLQTILTDRFQMRAHSETRPMPVYALVTGKAGSRLSTAAPGPGGWSTGRGRIAGHQMDMSTLADCLSAALGRIVVDRTGLPAQYDVSLTWAPDDQQGPSDSGPSLFTAIQEQLGLRLESTRAPVPVLLIDHIGKPSPN